MADEGPLDEVAQARLLNPAVAKDRTPLGDEIIDRLSRVEFMPHVD